MYRQAVFVVVLSALVLGSGPAFGQATAPQALRVQGFLSDNVTGEPVPADGTYSLTFRLFDDPLAGLMLAEVGPLAVDVSGGVYQVELPFGAEVFDGAERYLEIEVEGELLSPRLRVVSTPFAYTADRVGGLPAADLEESAEIDTKVAQHDAATGAHAAEIGAAVTAHASAPGAHAGEISAAVAAHEALPDAHPAYLHRGGDAMSGALAIDSPSNDALSLSAPGDVGISFTSGSGPTHAFGWNEATGAFVVDEALALQNGKLLHWPMNSGPSAGVATYSLSKLATSPPGQDEHPDGELDETFQFCYNCRNDGSTFQADPSQHSWNQKFEANYWNSIGRHEQLEVNWNFTDLSGYKWRPFAYVLQVTGNCSGGTQQGEPCISGQQIADCENGGGTCEGENWAKWDWNASPFGLCSVDHTILCKTADDCPGGSCHRASDLAVESGRGRLISRQGVLVDLFQPGTASASSYSAIEAQQDLEPSGTTTPFFGLRLSSTFTSAAQPDSAPTEWVGVEASQVFEGTTPPGRHVGDRMVGIDVRQELSQTAVAGQPGGGPTVPVLSGLSWQLQPSGSNLSVGTATGLRIESPGPLAGGGAQIEIGALDGVRIEDLKGYGTANHAIHVESQSGGDGDAGNIHMDGGGATSGHLRLGDGHLWYDDSSNAFRWKDGAGGAPPTGAGDGAPLHSPVGMSDDWGEALWGAKGGAASSGSLVCAQAGLECVGAFDLGAGKDRTCGYSNWGGAFFIAFCK